MSSISDEIRNWCEFEDGTECGGFVTKASFNKILALADRIDTEMVELSKDKDGVPIHVGDKVWDVRDGQKLSVIEIVMCAHDVRLYATPDETVWWYVSPIYITHTRPDSWERIADELEEWSEDNRVNGSGEVFYRARQLSDRIRRLAKREGE